MPLQRMPESTETIRRYIETVNRLTDGKRGLVWASFRYRCDTCGHEERVFLGYGVEGPDELKHESPPGWIASPFLLGCPQCKEGFMSHVDWLGDRKYNAPFVITYGLVMRIPLGGLPADAIPGAAFMGEVVRLGAEHSEREEEIGNA